MRVSRRASFEPRPLRGLVAAALLLSLALLTRVAGAPGDALLMLLPVAPLVIAVSADWYPAERLIARIAARRRRWRRPTSASRPRRRRQEFAWSPVGLLIASALAGRAPPALADCR
jgi:hypothetical protein